MMPLAIGLAGYALWSRRRRRSHGDDTDAARADRFARGGSFASDPADPVQGFDEASELRGIPLEVDALSQADLEAAQDLAGLESELEAQSRTDAEAAQELVESESEIEAQPGMQIRTEPGGEADDIGMQIRTEPGGESDEIDDDIVELTDRLTVIASAGTATRHRRRDAGDLYGGHTPAAVDRSHPDDDRAFDEGQNWIEALETSAIENGAEPEIELDEIIDDEDVLSPPHASDTRDTPVADHGAGGSRGL
jgi:hypothetical protein